MKKIYTYLAMFVAAATMVACENTPEGNVTPDATGKPIEITIGAQNRALLDLTDGKTVTWEEGDQIGLFHTVGESVSEECKNAPYTADAAGATATFTGEATWGENAEGQHNFYVYYPYRSDKCEKPAELIKTLTNKQTYDVTGDWAEFGAKYSFAYAKVENVTYGGKVELPPLKQLFCILRLNITNNTGSDIIINQVTVESDKTNIRRPYTIDITQAPATTTGEGTKLITCTVQNGTVANGSSVAIRVALGAEDYSKDTFTIVVKSNMGTHPAVTFTGKKLEQGECASKSITIEAAPTSAYKIGDIVDGGVLFWMDDDKKTGKVVCGQGYIGVMGTTNEALKSQDLNLVDDNGATNMTIYKNYASTNSLDFASSFPAPYFCDVLDGDWYLPARDELKALFAAYVGRANWDATSDLPSKTGSESGGAWVGTATARNAFNAALSSAPVISVATDSTAPKSNLTAFTGDNVFAISSSETSSGDNARLVKFNIRYETTGAKWSKSTKRITRCIKVVNLTE